MSAQPKPNEPSMEEILASIRRIIADDETKPAEADPVSGEAPIVEPAPANDPVASDPITIDEDILDLGAEAALLPAAEATQPAAEAAASDGDIDFMEPAQAEAAPAPIAPIAPVRELAREPVAPVQIADNPVPSFDMAQLLSDQASSAVNSAFGHLAHTVLTNNARTLEDLVKDMLKPMLKSWLDDNLPTMVERLVRAEIERVARGGRG
jgi:cell pole-organizing protein PopZ